MKEAEASALLRETSRSFYLTLRALPRAVRTQIGLAYLLARASDTIADTELIPVEQRLEALGRLRERVLGRDGRDIDFGELERCQASAAEGMLLRRAEEAARLLDESNDGDRARIRKVLEVIISGQELDLRRFGGASAREIVPLQTDAELDDYTWRVAGCVGEFWTEMCLAHLFEMGPEETARLRENGVRFGKGLQLVNILRDLPKDLRQGRCYLPEPRLAGVGLTPADLMNAETMPKFRPLYDSYLDLMEGHLAAGWEYTNALPRAQARVRLACAWLILIGAGTLRKLRAENVLDASRRIKISRGAVYRLMARSVLLHPWPGAWRRQFSTVNKDGK